MFLFTVQTVIFFAKECCDVIGCRTEMKLMWIYRCSTAAGQLMNTYPGRFFCMVLNPQVSYSDDGIKGKGFPYSMLSVGPRADPSVQAFGPQVTVSHPPGSRLPLLSTRPVVTFPVTEHHHPLAGTKLCCLVTEAHRCEQLAKGCYAALPK